MELWDAYNRNFEKIDGMTLVRGEEKGIPEGVYHLVNLILIRHTDGTYLIMQRSPQKSYAGMWEVTAGGSALKGETAYESAVRELREETGITEDMLINGLVLAEKAADDSTRSLYYTFLGVTDCGKDCITLQEGETCSYKWVTRDELLAMTPDELLGKRTRKFVEHDF